MIVQFSISENPKSLKRIIEAQGNDEIGHDTADLIINNQPRGEKISTGRF